MKKLIYIVFTIFFLACSNTQQNKEIIGSHSVDSQNTSNTILTTELVMEIELDSTACGLNFKPRRNYKDEKSEINKIRIGLSNDYFKTSDSTVQRKIHDSVMLTFTNLLLNNIIPYWYGTVWDFNGYTSTPNHGTIACGYFVSTTLRDMGLNLNRYKLAQQGPENEIKSIGIDLRNVRYLKYSNINKELKNLKEGLYFIGLNKHVGYLYKKSDNAYFIHSNYIDGKVMIENIENSEAFFSTNYYISKISGNRNLMEKWLKGEEIQVLTE